uniref:carboxypeptidase-like regulatory domain-containing protein n=1 Tax=Daejeonella sp. TaxID=2805397 RepID=UPI0037C0A1EC
MKKLLFIAAAVLLPFIASAQFSISGKISDKNSGTALNGAIIRVENTYSSARSDASGNYSLKNLKPGNYLVKISFLGYQTFERKISLNENTGLNVELFQNSLIADEVLVRATRASENSATTYSTINKEDLEKNNLGQDLPFLLNQTPSVVVSSDAGNGVGYTGIRIRGSDPTRLNVTINGIPYND